MRAQAKILIALMFAVISATAAATDIWYEDNNLGRPGGMPPDVGMEDHEEIPGEPLMGDTRRGRHGELSVQDLVAPAVVRQRAVILVGEDDAPRRGVFSRVCGHGSLDGPPPSPGGWS